MAAELFRLKTDRIIDQNGIADGAEIYFYATGTTTPAAVYTTDALNVAHPNPIEVDAGAPLPDIYLNPAVTYRYVVKDSDGVTIDDIDPYVRETPFVQSVTGGPLIKVDGAFEFGTRLTRDRYGFRANGSFDNTSAISDAIEDAEENGFREIIIPYEENGVAVVAGSIVNGELAAGLTFVGEGPRSTSEYTTGAQLLYTGSGTCWNIKYTDADPLVVGDWTWRNIAFLASNAAGTMFDCNDTVNTLPADDADISYLRRIRFEGCYFGGAQAGASQTGDAIRAAKAFAIDLDRQCHLRGWRRAIWLKGCDDATIAARLEINTRSIMNEGSGTFGNNLQLLSNWIGPAPENNSEDAYLFWDSGFGTTVFGTTFEGSGDDYEAALLYLAGLNTSLYSPKMASAPLFALASAARDIRLYAPGVSDFDTDYAPIIQVPASYDFGSEISNHRMMVFGAGKTFVKTVAATTGAIERIVFESGFGMAQDIGETVTVPVDERAAMLVDAKGYRPRRRTLTPRNHFSRFAGTIVSSGFTEVDEPLISGGIAFECSNSDSDSGIPATFTVGTDYMIGDLVKVSLPVKTASANWALYVLKNEVFHSTLIASLTSASYDTLSGTLDLSSGWANGDRITFVVLKEDTTSAALRVGCIDFSVVSAAVPNASGGSVIDVEARAELIAIKDALKARGDMA